MDPSSTSNGEQTHNGETYPPAEPTVYGSTRLRNAGAERRPRMESRPRINDGRQDELSSTREDIVVVEEERQRPDAESAIVGEETPLHVAVRNNDYDAIKTLLWDDADINARDSSGKTALHIAIELRSVGLLDTLLEFYPDLNMKTPNGMFPLHLAVTMGWKEGTEKLLHCGSYLDINATDADGNTALHLACSAGYRDIAYEVLRKHANVHICNSDGRTPLQLAAESRSKQLPELLSLLLQHGANIDEISHTREWIVDDQSGKATKGDQATRQIDTTEQDTNEETAAFDPDTACTKSGAQHWDGVRRDNGDGFILANYDNHDIFFDAKVESIQLLVHNGQDMHGIQLKLNFMKPFSTKNRIRYAKVDVKLAASDSGDIPHIHSVMPQADRVEVSEQEISTGQTFTVGASGGGGPSNVNINMEGSKSRKSTFKGVRIIHGVVKDRMHASWRMYEEPGSQSGLPEIVRLLLLVQCKAEFEARLSMSVKACHASSFGIPRTLTAKSRAPYLVPDVAALLKLERAMKLKNILNVADRAATSVEEATLLEREFDRLIKNHSKKALIMQARSQDDFVREWSNIADATREGDFSILHDKLLQMQVNDYTQHQTEEIIIEPADRSTRIIRETTQAMPRRYRSRSFRRRRSNGLDDEREYDKDYGRDPRIYVSRERPPNSQARTAMESFSAVGPGYKVSRLG